MDLPIDSSLFLSDDQDVAKLVQEEFQKQILADSEKSQKAQNARKNTDLWDSLWNSVDPVVNKLVNQVASPVFSPVFCLACDTMFFNRLTLEEHVCPFVSFICSCGIGFTSYPEMWSHSLSHNHKASYVVNHKSAIQNRINSVKEQESKLKFLEATAKNVGIVQKAVPATHSATSMTRYAVGRTINLWRRFKPVVKIETLQAFPCQRKYMCMVCREVMCNQDVLIEHVHASHHNTCIYGCIRCGLLLISSVTPKPHHKCGSLYTGPSKRFTVGHVVKDPLAADRLYMPYACQYCSLKFCHPVHLSNHIHLNHTNVSKLRVNKSQGSSAKRVQHTLKNMPNRTSQTQKQRCALCGKMNDSIKMLAQHWCVRKLTLFKAEKVTKMISEKDQQRSDWCSPIESDSEELTFCFQDISDMTTYGHTKLLTIKTEPVEVNLKMTQTDFSQRVSVKTEPDDDNGVEKAPTEMNRLFYQNCSTPNANNLKCWLSSI
ncbi:hypothetical protein SRHO_G00060880 [Serrasalmus rhombeus]